MIPDWVEWILWGTVLFVFFYWLLGRGRVPK